MLLRAAYLLSIRHAPFFEHLVTEPARYDAWARDIVRGVAPLRPPFDEGPAYPYFVALVYAIAGHNTFAVATLQALMDAASCALVAATAERISGQARAAWIAGVLAALYGPMIYFTGQLEPATMTIFATSLALFLTPLRKAKSRDWILCGVAWALAMLVRSEMILALPFVLAHAWRVEKRAAVVRVAAPAAALLAITLAINASSSRHAVLLTTGSGVNLWIGNNERADGVNPFVEGPMRQTTHEIERQTSDAVVADGLFRDRGFPSSRTSPAARSRSSARKRSGSFPIASFRTRWTSNGKKKTRSCSRCAPFRFDSESSFRSRSRASRPNAKTFRFTSSRPSRSRSSSPSSSSRALDFEW